MKYRYFMVALMIIAIIITSFGFWSSILSPETNLVGKIYVSILWLVIEIGLVGATLYFAYNNDREEIKETIKAIKGIVVVHIKNRKR